MNMGKLEKIKAELAKLLVKYTAVKTDNGILEYEGEDLVVNMDVFVTDENGDKIAPADGEYKTEDNKVITVKDGKVESIIEIEDEVEAADEVTEVIEEPAIEKSQEEVVDTPTEDAPEESNDEIKLEDVNEAIDNLRKEVNELYKLVDSILEKIGETRKEADERLSKIEQMSIAKPAAEEFEQLNSPKKTGDSKLDKFLSNYGK